MSWSAHHCYLCQHYVVTVSDVPHSGVDVNIVNTWWWLVLVMAGAEQNTGYDPGDWVHLHHLDTVTQPHHTWHPYLLSTWG